MAARVALRVGAGSLAALVVVGGALYFTGVLDESAPDTTSAALCEGLMPQDRLERFLGGQPLTSDDVITDRLDQEPQECSVRPRREVAETYYDELDVVVSRDAGSRELLMGLGRQMSDDWTQVVSPLGNGWRGVLRADDGATRAAVVMLCGDGGQGDGSVVVNLTARHLDESQTPATSQQRAQLARLATDTAATAAARAGCDAQHGTTVRDVAAPFPAAYDGSGATAPGKATGTCAGIATATRETEADPLAPIEDCLLLDEAGKPAFRLAAYYGPFVQDGYVATYQRGDSGKFSGPAGGADGLYWADAECPAQGGTAFFTSETLSSGEGYTSPDPALQQSALRRFAERSAKAHGCEVPVQPPVA
ncbi:hypothetical protein ACH40E_32260 [Streptomyces acidicola]|uniref:hypothetical protein n=1 Tax=Streptomyces acidicola TaxID=2596892 RepID=UPI00379258DC